MDHRQRSARNCFAGLALDRLADRRRDARWLRDRLQDPRSAVLVLWRSRSLVAGGAQAPRPVLLAPPALRGLPVPPEPPVLLGEIGGRVCFAVDLAPEDEAVPARLAAHGELRDLRAMGPLLGREDAALLAFARGILYWHRRHRHCGDCGSPTRVAEAGYVRRCTRESCARRHFPRTDPAIIVLVRRGPRCLLGRQPSWPAGMYSTLAGFVEPGESLEEAVAREVFEESGVRLGAIRYHSSQPWPFPGSLMLGFTASARSCGIRLADGELEDARWLSRADIEAGLREGGLRLPSQVSIARRLVEDWYDRVEPGRLARLVGDA